MPIKRRSNLPPVAKPPQGDYPFRQPGKPLVEIYRAICNAASNAAWDGNREEADKLEKQAAIIKQRIDDGELYEVDF